MTASDRTGRFAWPVQYHDDRQGQPWARQCRGLESTRRELSLSADRDHRLVGSPAVDVPELLEIGPVEIGELLPDIGERGHELIRLRRLADGGAQGRHDIRRRAFRREYPDPTIVFDAEAELLERRHTGDGLGARSTDHGER